MTGRSISTISKTSLSIVALAWALTVGGVAHADILIKNATLYDGTGKAAVKGANILVKGDRIAQVSTSAISAGRAQVIDGTGKFVMPGIFDSHVHVPGGQAGPVTDGVNRKPANNRAEAIPALHAELYSGVTSIYDSGNNEDFIYPLRADEQAGKVISPRIFVAGGVISVPNGYGAGVTALKATTWEETKKGLDAKLAKKPDMLKLIRETQGQFNTKTVKTLTDEQMKQITSYAKEHGVRTTVHASNELNSQASIDNGITALAHSVRNQVLNDSYIKSLVDNKIVVSTTAVGFAMTPPALKGDTSILDGRLFKAEMTEEELAKAKADTLATVKSGAVYVSVAGLPYARRNLKQLHEAGVILSSGTDRPIGAFTHVELGFLAECGISAFDLIKIATLNGAMYVGREKDLGSIEAGKYADLLVLDADPAADVKNFQAINTVIKAGKKIDLAKLEIPINQKKK